MIGYFAEVAPDKRYVQCIALELPAMEAPAPDDPANTLHPVSAPPAKWNRGPTEVLHLIDGVEQFVETASLEVLKARKRLEINVAKATANSHSFMFKGKPIAADEASIKEIMFTNSGVTRRGSFIPDWPGGWKTMDDSFVAIPDVATWYEFMDAIEHTGVVNFIHQQELKYHANLANSAEELALIKWGWGIDEP